MSHQSTQKTTLSFPNRVWFGIVEVDDALQDVLDYVEPYEDKEEETIHGKLRARKWKFYTDSCVIIFKVLGKLRNRMFLSVKHYPEKRRYVFILNQVIKSKKKVIPKFRLVAFPGDAQGGEVIVRGSKLSVAVVSNEKPAHYSGTEFGRDSGIIASPLDFDFETITGEEL